MAFAPSLQSTAPAAAEDWPSRPIRMMVGFGAGGGTDVATRIVAEPLGDVLGQRIVVENKPGAGGTIAGDLVAKGTKDGYNALMISTGPHRRGRDDQVAGLRRGEGLRAGRHHRQLRHRHRRAEGFSGERSERPDRGHQEGPGQIQLRHRRRRLDAASHRRAVPPARRPAGAGGVVSHHRRGRAPRCCARTSPSRSIWPTP